MFDNKYKQNQLGGKEIPATWKFDEWGRMPDLMEFLEMRKKVEA